MSDELGTEFTKLSNHILDVKESLCSQNYIIRLHRVPLTHNELIPVRIIHILRTDIHLIKVNLCQDLHNTHVAADVSGLSFDNHVNYIFS